MKKVFPRKMVCFHIFRGQFYNNGYEKNWLEKFDCFFLIWLCDLEEEYLQFRVFAGPHPWQQIFANERVRCLLVLSSVTSTPQWIR
jgi:hypothetical protein